MFKGRTEPIQARPQEIQREQSRIEVQVQRANGEVFGAVLTDGESLAERWPSMSTAIAATRGLAKPSRLYYSSIVCLRADEGLRTLTYSGRH